MPGKRFFKDMYELIVNKLKKIYFFHSVLFAKQLGYKSEIGYQTFLYSNEPDIRRLLMFLVDKIPKDNIGVPDKEQNVKNKEKKMSTLIAQKLTLMLEQCWTPYYCKQKSIRIVDAKNILKEGCANLKKFETISLAVPVSKNKYSKGNNNPFFRPSEVGAPHYI
jgi:hypothetical protein